MQTSTVADPLETTPMNFPNIRCAGRGAPGILSDDLTEAELDQIFRDRKKTIEKKSLVFFAGGDCLEPGEVPIFHGA